MGLISTGLHTRAIHIIWWHIPATTLNDKAVRVKLSEPNLRLGCRSRQWQLLKNYLSISRCRCLSILRCLPPGCHSCIVGKIIRKTKGNITDGQIVSPIGYGRIQNLGQDVVCDVTNLDLYGVCESVSCCGRLSSVWVCLFLWCDSHRCGGDIVGRDARNLQGRILSARSLSSRILHKSLDAES